MSRRAATRARWLRRAAVVVVVLAAGMVIVFEPIVWEDGHAGFRAEEIVAVTDSGPEMFTNLSWEGWE